MEELIKKWERAVNYRENKKADTSLCGFISYQLEIDIYNKCIQDLKEYQNQQEQIKQHENTLKEKLAAFKECADHLAEFQQSLKDKELKDKGSIVSFDGSANPDKFTIVSPPPPPSKQTKH